MTRLRDWGSFGRKYTVSPALPPAMRVRPGHRCVRWTSADYSIPIKKLHAERTAVLGPRAGAAVAP